MIDMNALFSMYNGHKHVRYSVYYFQAKFKTSQIETELSVSGRQLMQDQVWKPEQNYLTVYIASGSQSGQLST